MQTAQAWARKNIRKKHEEEYLELYNKYKDSSGTTANLRARAQSKAITELTKKYNIEYITYYEVAISYGYPPNTKKKK